MPSDKCIEVGDDIVHSELEMMPSPSRRRSRSQSKRESRVRLKYESCCFQIDRQFVTFVVQTLVGLFVLSFCGWQLASIDDCDRSTPYWGLIGTITGFFFRTMAIKRET